MDPSKVSFILSWPEPSIVREVRAFLGLTGYYRCFIKGFSSIAALLTNFLASDAFSWTPTASTAFAFLKQAITSAPILAIPDFSSKFFMETDALGIAISAVLLQLEHPIAYFSKKMCPRMRAASVYIREL